jgi:hypothetical protein
MNTFKRIANSIMSSTYVIPVFLVCLVTFVVALRLSIEDYWTTYEGYKLVPTMKTAEDVAYIVALLPQLGQLFFGYLFLDSPKKGWALVIAMALFAADVYTDVRFKAQAGGAEVVLVALAESIIVFTLGSELMLLASFGVLLNMITPFFAQIKILAAKLMGLIFGGDDEPRHQQTRDQQHQQHQRPAQSGDRFRSDQDRERERRR